MTKGFAVIAGLLFALVAFPAAAQNFKADLSAKNENPAVQSDGVGQFMGTLDAKAKTMKWELRFWNLSGAATAAHIHGPADAKSNAGVLVPLMKTGDKAPFAGTATLSDAQIADLNAGKMYVNVHTAKNAPGEVRGQVMKAQ